MASAAVLYTPEVLGLATSLARFPIDDTLPLVGQARSASCGSTLKVALALDSAGVIARVGLAAHACAIGQAAAAIFAQAAVGQTSTDITKAEHSIAAWLAGATGAGPETALPDWSGLAAIAAAAGFPARHGAILLGWRAAIAAFASAEGAD